MCYEFSALPPAENGEAVPQSPNHVTLYILQPISCLLDPGLMHSWANEHVLLVYSAEALDHDDHA